MVVEWTNFTAFDDRGSFINVPVGQFDPARVYVCKNFETGMVRAFHGHQKEYKAITCIHGAIKLVTAMMNAEKGSLFDFKVWYLSDSSNNSIVVPPAMAHGWQSLKPDSTIMVFSNSPMHESIDDDIRFDANLYDWSIKWR